ncbi:hypothetical protein F4777DRAFT_580102 [Nemania sp. FL0916]|nr:hypothetical protein F4777DRAFT_580102 [Nemania sp. FL0916]
MTTNHRSSKVQLEEYRNGYPRLAAFLNLDDNFSILKRFDYLHMRSLLDLQDQLSELEDKLHDHDDAERVQLQLSSRRQDGNLERRELLSQIREKLEIYDKSVQDFNTILQLPEARTRQRQSVKNWFLGNKPLVRSESKCFLNADIDRDYVSLGMVESDRAGLEALFDAAINVFPSFARKLCVSRKSLDLHIFLFPPRLFGKVAKACVAIILPVWLILPTILLFNAGSHSSRAIIYAMFTILTSIVVVFTTNPRKYDLMLALITYATLMGAFLAGGSS